MYFSTFCSCANSHTSVRKKNSGILNIKSILKGNLVLVKYGVAVVVVRMVVVVVLWWVSTNLGMFGTIREPRKINAFLYFYYKTQCILNLKSIFEGNLAMVNWRNYEKKNAFLRKKLHAFLYFYHETQCILNMKSIFEGNLAIVNWKIWEKNVFLRKK